MKAFVWMAFSLLLLPALGLAKELQGIRGTFLDFVKDPFFFSEQESVRFQPDGLLVVEDGKIKDFGPFAELRERYPDLEITTYSDKLILPGLIDSHIHYPQTRMIAAYGNELLQWLNASVWPEEIRFRDKGYATEVADNFLNQLLRNGTTTAQIFTTTFPDSVDAIFEQATRRNMRIISGLTGIDRKGQAPAAYLDTAESFYQDSRRLLQKWHGKGRNLYAVTPRFAAGSSDEMLQRAGELLREFPGVYLNTHLAENTDEVALVKRLFPWSTDYLNVYEHYGLVGPRFTGGHSVHLSDSELARMSKAGAAAAFCPSSNLFLGSGFFRIAQAKSPIAPVRVGLGTDMGGGNTFSLLTALDDAYKVGMAQGYRLSAFKGLYLATRGSAEALYLDDKLGTFDPGKEADFVVMDLMATPAMAARNRTGEVRSMTDLAYKAFGLMMLGTDQSVTATYVAGQALYVKKM